MEHIPGQFSSVHLHFPLVQMLSKQSSHFTGTEHLNYKEAQCLMTKGVPVFTGR